MIARNSVRHKNETGTIPFSVPPRSVTADADLRGLIRFGISKGLVPPFVPSPPAKHSHPRVERLLEIDSETILDGSLRRMSGDVRFRSQTGKKIVYRSAVAAHVGVIHKAQESNDSFLMVHHRTVKLELHVFRARPADVRIQVNAVGYFRHQHFSKPHRPAPLVNFDHGPEGKAPRVRRVVVCSIVVRGPVHELKTGVRTIRIGIEEVHHTEFSEANLKPALGKR